MSRIQGFMDTKDAIITMADGNPGALTSMMSIAPRVEVIDPQALFGFMAVLFELDSYQIYGSAIYVLFNDKCNRDVRKMLLLLRAVQLGFVCVALLQELAADQMGVVNLDADTWQDIESNVCGALEFFAKPTTSSEV